MRNGEDDRFDVGQVEPATVEAVELDESVRGNGAPVATQPHDAIEPEWGRGALSAPERAVSLQPIAFPSIRRSLLISHHDGCGALGAPAFGERPRQALIASTLLTHRGPDYTSAL